jgi:hypothetical protein
MCIMSAVCDVAYDGEVVGLHGVPSNTIGSKVENRPV